MKLFNNRFKLLYGSLFLIINASCQKNEIPTSSTPETPSPAKIFIVKPNSKFQTITGFGGANRMWGTQSLKPSEATKAFGLDENQLGLSLFRVRVSSKKEEWPIIVEAVKEANKNNVKVLASPWSPPANLKNNKSDIRGHLLPENYKAFKDYLNEFIVYMNSNGAKIDVISIQNEPDWKPNYESCDWTSDEMINFLNAPGTVKGAKLSAPESLNFNQTFTNSILQNPIASSQIDIVSGHIYGGGLAKFPLAEEQKKEIWMTEFLLNLDTGNSGAAKWNTYSEAAKWAESVKMLVSVHDAMKNNWNAYIWWYLQRYYSFIGDGEEGTVNGEVLKRGYAFSHFSKFIRPGFVRIDLEEPANNFLKISAYQKDNKTIIVAINPEAFTIKNIQLKGLNVKSATTYLSTETNTLKKEIKSINDNIITLDIPPTSVVTLVIEN